MHSSTTPRPSALTSNALPIWRWRQTREFFVLRWKSMQEQPHAMALGISIGVAISFTPFIGLQLLIALAVAQVLRANPFGVLLGTMVANPLTLPFIALFSISTGAMTLGGSDATAISTFHMALQGVRAGEIADTATRFFGFYLLGGAMLGLISAPICYLSCMLWLRSGRNPSTEQAS